MSSRRVSVSPPKWPRSSAFERANRRAGSKIERDLIDTQSVSPLRLATGDWRLATCDLRARAQPANSLARLSIGALPASDSRLGAQISALPAQRARDSAAQRTLGERVASPRRSAGARERCRLAGGQSSSSLEAWRRPDASSAQPAPQSRVEQSRPVGSEPSDERVSARLTLSACLCGDWWPQSAGCGLHSSVVRRLSAVGSLNGCAG